MAIANSPITLFAMEKAGPLGRLLSAGERLSNLAYHIATNKGTVDERLRGEFDACRKAWDDATGEYAAVLRAGADHPSGVGLIAAERARQVTAEGWTPEHDDAHNYGELVTAAMSYAIYGSHQTRGPVTPDQIALIRSRWPWEPSWWKPSEDPIRNLVKAGALIAAEIDRLQRANVGPDASRGKTPVEKGE